MKDFVIHFSGLTAGKHTFEYKLDGVFFENAQIEEVSKGDVQLVVELEKSESMLVFSFAFQGVIQCICDRCLGDLELPIKGNQKLFVKFGEEETEIDDEVIVVKESEYKIDLAPYIRDYLITSIPLKKAHELGINGNASCKTEMLSYIQAIDEEPTEIDPRWEKLKEIK